MIRKVVVSGQVYGLGVQPEEKTEDMTRPVGADENGRLWTAPGGGSYRLVSDITLTEPVAELLVSETDDGRPYNFSKILVLATVAADATVSSATIRANVNHDAGTLFRLTAVDISQYDHLIAVKGWIEGGRWFSDCAHAYYSTSNREDVILRPDQFGWYDKIQAVTSVRFFETLTAGTNIRIYAWEE